MQHRHHIIKVRILFRRSLRGLKNLLDAIILARKHFKDQFNQGEKETILCHISIDTLPKKVMSKRFF